MPKETGLLMQPWGIDATIKGIKKQTSRVFTTRKKIFDDLSWVKSGYQDGGGNWILWSDDGPDLAEFTKKVYPTAEGFPCPYGNPGDLIYLREPHYAYGNWKSINPPYRDRLEFVIESEEVRFPENPPDVVMKFERYRPLVLGWYKRSPLFMPKRVARHWLKVSGVQLKRIQAITDDEVLNEGIFSTFLQLCGPKGTTVWSWEKYPTPKFYDSARAAFFDVWDEINKHRGFGWNFNPLCWMISYKYLGTNKTEV